MCIYLHNVAMVPQNGVSVEVRGRVKPEVNPLLSVTLSVSVDVCLNCVRLSSTVPQELEIKLVANIVRVRVQLAQRPQ